MWTRTAQVAALLRQSHRRLAVVNVLNNERAVRTLLVKDGSVNTEARRAVTRNLSCTLLDETGELTGGDVDDLLNPYDCEIAVSRGLVTPTGALYVPQGVYQLTQRAVPGDGQVTITGQDRAVRYQGGMSSTLAIPAGTPVERAIELLLLSRNSGLAWSSWKTGFTCGPLLYQPDIDVWREAQDLAVSVGGWLAHDRTGLLTFAASLPTSTRAVATYRYGDGALLGAERSEDSDTIRNVVVMRSEKTGTGGVIEAVVRDDDPLSPTYYRGRYGERPVVITNQHIGSVAQAQAAGAVELARQLGRSETMSIEVLPDPFLDPLDVLGVHSPRHGIINRMPVIEGSTLPLGPGRMALQLRKSIIGATGLIYDASSTVTTS